MLLENGTYTGGPLDVLLILHDVNAGTYHAAHFEEKPPPGPVPEVGATDLVRLKSARHHPTGAPDLAGAQVHLDALAANIHLPDGNVLREEAIPWDGRLAVVWFVQNWRREGGPSLMEALRMRSGSPVLMRVEGGATGIKTSATTGPVHIGRQDVSGAGSVGIELDD